MDIKSIVIFANTEKEKVRLELNQMNKWFSSLGKTVHIVELTGTSSDYLLDIPEADFAVSLGGDGTVLTCAVILKDSPIPLMAVNIGSFGYITEVPVSEYKEVFKSFENNESSTISRMMIDVSVSRDSEKVFSSTALNDVTISVNSRAKVIKLNLYINGTLASNLKSDGLIVATPTGSTAYSLAAGGPILEASLNSIIINPICPFSMSVRPLVVSDLSEISIKVPKQKADIILTPDGHDVFEIKEGDVITISKSVKTALFVENKKRNFIEILRDKLGWAGGFNA